MSHLRWLVIAVAAAATAGGCEPQQQTVDNSSGAPRMVEPAGGPDLIAQSRPPISDLPMPVGYSLDEGKSRSFMAAGARYVDHIYRGRADKYQLVRFFKRQMPAGRWVLVEDVFVQGDWFLDFEKEGERCRITIEEGNLFYPSTVKVILRTSGRVENAGMATAR
jgi:hypothetical protein